MPHRRLALGSLTVLTAILAAHLSARGGGSAPQSCEPLRALSLPDTVIESAESVSGASFSPAVPSGSGAAARATLTNLPAFCRVAGVVKPAVRFEVWLPQSGWSGRFQGVGNGANAGAISYTALAAALKRGYASASTDGGHATSNARDASWALGHPELVADFGHRALHVTTETAKRITAAYYGRPAEHSYYTGCSTGGRQGLMEAQRHPDDYDGIVAGAPAANWTRFQAGGHLWAVLALNKDPESYVPAGKLPLINDAVNAACDALDGVVDGVLDDPRTCRFDPGALACRQGQDPESCLTDKQVKAVRDIWSGPRNKTGLVYPPYMRGAEAAGGWASYTTGKGPLTGNHWEQAENVFKYMIFENPAWDFRSFDYDRDVAFADAKLGRTMNAFDPDLGKAQKRGAKIILYHGWNDPSISPVNTINYYESVVSHLQGRDSRARAEDRAREFIRLFMVPGMLHCSGGPGPDRFDMLSAIEEWVERGVAPDTVLASHSKNGVVDRTRPLCAYPKVAVYKGAGSTDDAANFSCQLPVTPRN